MKQALKKAKRIPKFRDDAEEREFWQTHDSTDYVDWSTARRVRFPNLRLSTTSISLRLPTGMLDQIKVEANKRDVAYQSLIKIWLAEKVSWFMPALNNLALLAGRILIAALFVFDAYIAVGSWAGTGDYMQSYGLPAALLPLAVLLQFAGGLMIVFGVWTRLAALALAAFCLATAATFHHNFGSTSELIQAGKDLGLAGGFLFLAVAGSGRWSVDEAFRPA